jgi:DNA-binding transcriptional MerR regulator
MVKWSGGDDMEYTVQKLAEMAGISTRTLRYYDEINILKPARINPSGYRIYGQAEVDRLQQILFYRELGMKLAKIKEIVCAPDFDRAHALREYYSELLKQRARLDQLITNVEKTIALIEGRITMDDQEKFEGFKKRLIENNEAKYGKEIRAKYGNEAVDNSNQKLMNMSPEQFKKVEKLENELLQALNEAFKTGDPAGELAQKAADLHRQWLACYWDRYTKEAHAGVVQMYVNDERFTAYYDKEQPGTAAFLKDAVMNYINNQ